MSLEWMPRDNEKKDHALHTDVHWGTEPPCVVYEKRPLKDPEGNVVAGFTYHGSVLTTPNSTTPTPRRWSKGVIAAFENASLDRSVVAAVFTGTGPYSFCTGGNTKEYSEYYSRRPDEYGQYMELFNHMVDAILACKKPVICRVNGMRVAGGQEIGMACDLAISSDLAIFGQAGPKHGSAPVGGASDFLPWYLSIEDAMWNCVSCEMWSAYKMKMKNLISKCVPVLKVDGKWVRNPMIVTDKYVEDGEIVYGEYKTGSEAKEARAFVKEHQPNADFELLDKEVDKIVWTFANLFPGCLIESIDSIRAEKEIFLGYHEERPQTLAGSQHGRRGLLGLWGLQHQEDHRQGYH